MFTDKEREYHRNWYHKNKEKRREESRTRMRDWRKNNPEAANKAVKQWASHNPNYRRDYRLKKDYGITLIEWNELFEGQDFKCAICKSVTHAGRGWHLDHCHVSGRVRGILCNHCNLMIGHAKDNPQTLISAAAYLSLAVRK